jgi:hypothetical protein
MTKRLLLPVLGTILGTAAMAYWLFVAIDAYPWIVLDAGDGRWVASRERAALAAVTMAFLSALLVVASAYPVRSRSATTGVLIALVATECIAPLLLTSAKDVVLLPGFAAVLVGEVILETIVLIWRVSNHRRLTNRSPLVAGHCRPG